MQLLCDVHEHCVVRLARNFVTTHIANNFERVTLLCVGTFLAHPWLFELQHHCIVLGHLAGIRWKAVRYASTVPAREACHKIAMVACHARPAAVLEQRNRQHGRRQSLSLHHCLHTAAPFHLSKKKLEVKRLYNRQKKLEVERLYNRQKKLEVERLYNRLRQPPA